MRPEYEKFKSFTEVPQILNVISGLKEIGIKYYTKVDGYSLFQKKQFQEIIFLHS